MVSLGDKRRSKKSRRPRAIFSGVSGLSAGIGTSTGRPSGTGLGIAEGLEAKERRGPKSKEQRAKRRTMIDFRTTPPTLMVTLSWAYEAWFLRGEFRCH